MLDTIRYRSMELIKLRPPPTLTNTPWKDELRSRMMKLEPSEALKIVEELIKNPEYAKNSRAVPKPKKPAQTH